MMEPLRLEGESSKLERIVRKIFQLSGFIWIVLTIILYIVFIDFLMYPWIVSLFATLCSAILLAVEKYVRKRIEADREKR